MKNFYPLQVMTSSNDSRLQFDNIIPYKIQRFKEYRVN